MTEHGRRDYELGVLTDRAFRTLLATKVQLRSRHYAPLPLAVLCVHLAWEGDADPSLGPDLGAQLVQSATERIVDCLRVGDDITRSDPAHFRIVLDPLSSMEVAHTIAHRIGEALSRPFPVAGMEVAISAALGLAIFPDDGLEAERLIAMADRSLQQARSGRGLKFTPG